MNYRFTVKFTTSTRAKRALMRLSDVKRINETGRTGFNGTGQIVAVVDDCSLSTNEQEIYRELLAQGHIQF